MNRYLKLVNFELNRFSKIYAVLIALTILSQIAGVIVSSKQYLKMANEEIYTNLVPKAQFLADYGKMSLSGITQSMWFMGPIVLSIAALMFYVFLIWYRDWFGKNTFIYRLLMLPTSRLHVFLAKATTIFLMVLGLVSLQLVLFPIESRVLQWVVPLDFRIDMGIKEIIESFNYLAILFPNSFIEFMIHYGIGFMTVFVVFTAILFERSYRLKGIVFGALYCAVAVIIFLLPVLVQAFMLPEYFYPMEMFFLEIVMWGIVTAGSIWVSSYLLKNKISV